MLGAFNDPVSIGLDDWGSVSDYSQYSSVAHCTKTDCRHHSPFCLVKLPARVLSFRLAHGL